MFNQILFKSSPVCTNVPFRIDYSKSKHFLLPVFFQYKKSCCLRNPTLTNSLENSQSASSPSNLFEFLLPPHTFQENTNFFVYLYCLVLSFRCLGSLQFNNSRHCIIFHRILVICSTKSPDGHFTETEVRGDTDVVLK